MARCITYRALIKKLRKYKIKVDKGRGKGSHRMLIQDGTEIGYPLPYHGDNNEYNEDYMNSIERVFNIPKNTL